MRRFSTIQFGCAILAMLGVIASTHGAPVLLFSENFNGYTHFPVAIPAGDPVNLGIPEVSEGAQKFWYAGRFQGGEGTIDSDLAVQKWGSNLNETPSARFEDGAGLIFRIDTTGFANILLDFDWRTFATQPVNRFVVGYHVGDDLGLTTTTNRLLTLDWTKWTELLRSPRVDAFRHEQFSLPSNVGPVYVAFWIQSVETQYGKIDNIAVNAGSIVVIPEPAAGVLSLFALVILGKRCPLARSL